MADSIRVFDPGFRVTDTSGNPVSGAKCKFYNAGGIVARTVYSDADLTVSLGSTVTCNSGGSPAASGGAGAQVLIHTGTTPFKIVITDSADDPLYEFDNMSGALDTSSFDADTAIPRTSVEIKSTNYSVLDADRGKVFNVDSTGGNVQITLPSAVTVGNNWRVTVRHTGTANAVTIAAPGGQTINGATSLTLSYQFESVTLVSDGANYHVAEDAFVRYPAGVVLPQGYLTPTTGVPIITTGVTAGTAVYYTPFVGNLVPLYSGVRFVPYEFSELTLTLVAQHAASTIYDVFAFLDSSTLRIGTGPAWSNSSSATGARGTGAGTTQISRVNGVFTNTVSMTARNGTDTYTVDAGKGTYLGSIFIDGTQGQITCHKDYGQSRKWGIWNAYNRRQLFLKAGDATGSWNYGTNTLRPSNNATANSLTVFCGLAEEMIEVSARQKASGSNGAGATSRVGVGWNSTTAASGYAPTISTRVNTNAVAQSLIAHYTPPPTLGIVTVTMLEAATDTTAFSGAESDMMLTAEWMG
jgi:hypothetical protein